MEFLREGRWPHLAFARPGRAHLNANIRRPSSVNARARTSAFRKQSRLSHHGVACSTGLRREGNNTMTSSGTEPGVESGLLDLERVPFTKLRELDDETLRSALHHVVERAHLVQAPYRSSNSSGGERID